MITCSAIDKHTDRSEVYANINIKIDNNNKIPASLKVKVDTGAEGNILPLRIFQQMYPRKIDARGIPKTDSIEQKNTTLIAYNGSVIKQFGSIMIPCSYADSPWHQEEFYITDVSGPAILGLQGSTKLKLVTLHCPIQTSPQLTKDVPITDTHHLQQSYPDRFQGLGEFHGNLHITLKENSQPVIQPPRKYPIQLVPEINMELKKMETLGVITPVEGPTDWVNSLAFSRKPSGKLRVCLDPKDLNRNIKRTYHKTPTIEEITNRFSGAKVFSKLDARHGYWSVKLDEESSYLTTFNSPSGRYRFTRLPFGLNVSQDVFQRHMDGILSECPGTLGITDDIAVYGKDDEEHDRNLRNLMEVARKKGLVFNEEKCHIKCDHIKFFGMIYDATGVHPDPEKSQEVKSLPPPKNIKDLQRFLGMVQYLSPFIPKLSDHTAPLRALTKKDTAWQWTASHQKAFEDVKALICDDMSLSYFDVNTPAVIQVDSSQLGLGAALIQNGKPIAFASKALTDTETRYANIERELLAVVFGCERFHTYVFGKPFTVESDHKPLEEIQKKSLANTPPRLQRLMLRLQQYDMKIVYRPGKEMAVADALSRLSPTNGPEIDMEASIFAVHFSTGRLQQLKEETQKDHTLMSLKQAIVEGWPGNARDLPKPIRCYWSMRDELTVEDNIILRGDRTLIPESMKPYIMEQIHSAHMGIEKCRLRAQASVFWPGISRDIENYVKNCDTCLRHQRNQPHQPLMPHDVPELPWQTVGADIMTLDGQDHIVLVDYHSKMPFIRRTGSAGQTTTASVISAMSQVFGEHGIPERLISDNGTPFSSTEFRAFARKCGFSHDTSSPRYPQSNGLVERNIQTIKNTMVKAKETHTDVNMALLAFRSTPIDHSLPSPAEMLYNRKLRTTLPSVSRCSPAAQPVLDQLRHRQQKQKVYHDRTARDLPPLFPGHRVMMQKEEGGKWTPATVSHTCKEPRSYIVQTPNGAAYRRNRRHLIGIQQPRETSPSDTDLNSLPVAAGSPSAASGSSVGVQADQQPAKDVLLPTAPAPDPQTPIHSRPPRTHKQPAYLRDYVV